MKVIANCIFSLLIICTTNISAKSQSSKLAVPLEPVGAVIEAFKNNDIVALGEGTHNNEQAHLFRLELIRSPEFSKNVNDIVVEFGSSRYQSLIDRFINGEDIKYTELRNVWMNTTQIHEVWDVPIYEEFFHAVREVNKDRPKEEKLRVILGDPPIDWTNIKSGNDYTAARNKTDRKQSPVNIIQREVLSKSRKALIIYGDNHFMRKKIYWAFKNEAEKIIQKNERAVTIVTLLEEKGASVFSIWTNAGDDIAHLQRDLASWKIPSLTLLKDTKLGAKSFASFYDVSRWAPDENGKLIEFKLDPKRSSNMQEQYDAILYVGPKSSITKSKIPAKLCMDDQYLETRLGRMSLLNMGEHLETYCKSIVDHK